MATVDLFAVGPDFYNAGNAYSTRPRTGIYSTAPSAGTTQTRTVTNKREVNQAKDSASESKVRTQSIDKQTIDPVAKQALQQLLNSITLSTSADPLLQASDTAKLNNLQYLQSIIGQLNPNDAMQRAQGQIQDLTRQLQEQILPELQGSAETARTSSNALGQLLANDLVTRTAEAQNRAVEQARNTSIEQINMLSSLLNDTANAGSTSLGQLASLIDLGRGTVERGTVGETSNVVAASETDNRTAGTTTTTQDVVQGVDPAMASLAKAAAVKALLGPFQSLNDLSINQSPLRTVDVFGQTQGIRNILAGII